jgi:hypothetical protein
MNFFHFSRASKDSEPASPPPQPASPGRFGLWHAHAGDESQPPLPADNSQPTPDWQFDAIPPPPKLAADGQTWQITPTISRDSGTGVQQMQHLKFSPNEVSRTNTSPACSREPVETSPESLRRENLPIDIAPAHVNIPPDIPDARDYEEENSSKESPAPFHGSPSSLHGASPFAMDRASTFASMGSIGQEEGLYESHNFNFSDTPVVSASGRGASDLGHTHKQPEFETAARPRTQTAASMKSYRTTNTMNTMVTKITTASLISFADAAGGTPHDEELVGPRPIGRGAEEAAGVGPLSSAVKNDSPLADATFLRKEKVMLKAGAHVTVYDGFGSTIAILPGDETEFEVNLNDSGAFEWTASNLPKYREDTRPPLKTNWVVAYYSAGLGGFSISWAFYTRTFGLPLGAVLVGHRSRELVGVGRVDVQDGYGNEFSIDNGEEVTYQVRLYLDGYFSWRHDGIEQRTQAPDANVTWIRARHQGNGREIVWKFYRISGLDAVGMMSSMKVEVAETEVQDRRPEEASGDRSENGSEHTDQMSEPLRKDRPGWKVPRCCSGGSTRKRASFFSYSLADRPFCTMHCPCFFCWTVLSIILVLTGLLFQSPEINTDFDTFLEADSRANEVRNAYLSAIKSRGGSSSGRRLMKAGVFSGYEGLDPSILHKIHKLQIVYSMKSGGISIRSLNEIKLFEAKLKGLSGFQKLCIGGTSPKLTPLCEPGASFINFVWPRNLDLEAKYQTQEYVKYNLTGLGREPLPWEAAIEIMDKVNMRGPLFPRDFTGAHPPKMRSMFEFDLRVCTVTDSMTVRKRELARIAKEYAAFIKDEVYPLFKKQTEDESASFTINWKGDVIDGHEVWITLMSDAQMAIGSCVFIWMYLTFHTRSPLISTVSLILVVLAIPVAFVTSSRLSGGSSLTGASFLSLFLIVGLGADVVLVFVASFEASRFKADIEMYDYPARVRHVYKIAGKACLATSMTTCASFFANLASVLKPLREFGFFMGLCIVYVYILIVVALPPVLITNEKIVRYIARRSKERGGRMAWLYKDPEEGKPQDLNEGSRWVRGYYTNVIWPLRKYCLVAFAIVPLVMMIWTGCVIKVDGNMPEMFPEEHNQAMVKKVLAQFNEISEWYLNPTIRICNMDKRRPNFGANCLLTWCRVGIGSPLQSHGSSGKNCSQCDCVPTESLTGVTDESQCRLKHGKDAAENNVPRDVDLHALVRFVGPHNIPNSFWMTKNWTDFLKKITDQTNGIQLKYRAVSSRGSSGLNLSTMIQEHWETGKVQISRFILGADAVIRVAAESPQGKHKGKYCSARYMCYCGAPSCTFRDESLLDPGPPKSSWTTLTIAATAYTRRLQSDGNFAFRSVGPAEAPFGKHATTAAAFLTHSSRHLKESHKGVDVTLVWGLKVTEGTPVLGDAPKKPWAFDPRFRPDGPRAQRHMYHACVDTRKIPNLLVAQNNHGICWIEEFRNFLLDDRELFPTRATRFGSLLKRFLDKGLLEKGNSVTDFMWLDADKNLQATYVVFNVDMSPLAPSAKALNLMNNWNTRVDGLNAAAPMDAQNAWHTSRMWIRAEAEKAIIDSTVATLVVALSCGYVGTFCFTGFDLVLSGFVVLSVTCVTICLAWFMSALMGWATGAIEVLGLIVFVGYSITYSLHIAHKYGTYARENEYLSIATRRKDATKHALVLMANSVMGSAVTTLGASFFLFFCAMAIFVKLAAVLFAVTFFAAVYSLAGLPSALVVCGPVGRCGCGAIVARINGDSLGYEEADNSYGATPDVETTPSIAQETPLPGLEKITKSLTPFIPAAKEQSGGFVRAGTPASRTANQKSEVYLTSGSSPMHATGSPGIRASATGGGTPASRTNFGESFADPSKRIE